jgi:hypothetical protein
LSGLCAEHTLPAFSAAKFAPVVDRGCLNEQQEGKLVENAIRFKRRCLLFWNPHFTGADIARAKEHGMICNLLHSDNPEKARGPHRLRVDGALTNYANRILPAVMKIMDCWGNCLFERNKSALGSYFKNASLGMTPVDDGRRDCAHTLQRVRISFPLWETGRKARRVVCLRAARPIVRRLLAKIAFR